MSLDAAQKFIVTAAADQTLVQTINEAGDDVAIRQILAENGFEFNYEEFEKAYFNVLTWCQTVEQASAVKEVKQWWDCLGGFLGVSGDK